MTLRLINDSEELVLEDGTTIADIIHALDRVKKEKARQADKYYRCVKPKRESTKKAREPPAC